MLFEVIFSSKRLFTCLANVGLLCKVNCLPVDIYFLLCKEPFLANTAAERFFLQVNSLYVFFQMWPSVKELLAPFTLVRFQLEMHWIPVFFQVLLHAKALLTQSALKWLLLQVNSVKLKSQKYFEVTLVLHREHLKGLFFSCTMEMWFLRHFLLLRLLFHTGHWTWFIPACGSLAFICMKVWEPPLCWLASSPVFSETCVGDMAWLVFW